MKNKQENKKKKKIFVCKKCVLEKGYKGKSVVKRLINTYIKQIQSREMETRTGLSNFDKETHKSGLASVS